MIEPIFPKPFIDALDKLTKLLQTIDSAQTEYNSIAKQYGLPEIEIKVEQKPMD